MFEILGRGESTQIGTWKLYLKIRSALTIQGCRNDKMKLTLQYIMWKEGKGGIWKEI